MRRFLSRLFIPQESNNHRALILQPSFLGIFIAIYLLNQSLLQSLTIARPGILGYSSEITADKVWVLTNKERQKQNLPALRYNSLLSESAAAKARDMFAKNYWAHSSPNGESPWDFFRDAGYQYSIAGENLAKDFYDTESLLKAWMNSPTHRANIINSKYQEIGIGVVNGLLNGLKTTLVVEHFGTPIDGRVLASAPAPPVSTTAENFGPATSLHPINPALVSKILGSIMFVIIIGVLIIDSYITLKNRTSRLTGSSASHVAFLAIILTLLIFSRQGTIF